MKQLIMTLLFSLVLLTPAMAVTIPTIPVWTPPTCSGVITNIFGYALYYGKVYQREMTPWEAFIQATNGCASNLGTAINYFWNRDNRCTIFVATKAYLAHSVPRAIEEKWFRIATGGEFYRDAWADQDYYNAAYARAYKYCKK
jgi:hypothetical protein